METKCKKQLLTLKETALFLNIKESRIRSAIFQNEIPYIKIGRLIRFNVSDLDKWIESTLRNYPPTLTKIFKVF